MTQLVKIGNSKGIRIPKPLIEQAHLEGKELTLKVVDNGLLLTPCKKPRQGWDESIKATLATHGSEALDQEWLDADLTNDDELAW